MNAGQKYEVGRQSVDELLASSRWNRTQLIMKTVMKEIDI